jgi:hypothetical protein
LKRGPPENTKSGKLEIMLDTGGKDDSGGRKRKYQKAVFYTKAQYQGDL